ncbi:hypothetical protein [Tautonia rosea]|uniref:hypothetical protein n=1 Tax=Tautonia rosea TaxID=2728037 RepID=UPI00147524CF|nr:hypothetical protein [Tautonia rosea]
MAKTNTLPAKSEAETEIPRTAEELRSLLDRAKLGDRSTLPQVRALLSDPERSRWYVENLGSPPNWLKNHMAERVAPKDLMVRESFHRKLDEVREELAGPDPTPMERLLAERAAWCWAEVNIRQISYEQAENLTLRQAEFQQKRIDAAHRRFLSAIKTLATVRKLALPALRINVAQNQVNLG